MGLSWTLPGHPGLSAHARGWSRRRERQTPLKAVAAGTSAASAEVRSRQGAPLPETRAL